MNSNGRKNSILITIQTNELWLLLNQLAPATIMGMTNPFEGWLVEEIEVASDEALQALIERDLVRRVSDDEIALDEVLAGMVVTMAHPDHYLSVNYQNGSGEARQHHVYFGNDLIIERRVIETDQHHLAALRDHDALLEHLGDALPLASEAASTGDKFSLDEDTLSDVRELVAEDQSQKAVSILVEAGVTEESAKGIVASMSNPVANTLVTAMINLSHRDTQHTRNFAVLEGKEDMWLICPYQSRGKACVEFIPASAEMVRERFLETLP